MKRHLALAVVAVLFCTPQLARAEDGGLDAGDGGDAGGSTSSSSSSSSSSGDIGEEPAPFSNFDGGSKVPGSGRTEPAEDEGCRTAPSSPLAPGAVVLALASLWFLRRKRR